MMSQSRLIQKPGLKVRLEVGDIMENMRLLNSTEALEAMIIFLDMYWERGRSDDIGDLLSSLTLLEPTGHCADEALWNDWERSVRKVIQKKGME